jgi:DtxR family Mn-dependent transcriptional regulator
MAHDHATVAEEEYLETIFWLQEAGLPMTGANVARARQLSAPTVHEMIGRLEKDGYITRGATARWPSRRTATSTRATSCAATG